jgi:hypothetical protein
MNFCLRGYAVRDILLDNGIGADAGAGSPDLLHEVRLRPRFPRS